MIPRFRHILLPLDLTPKNTDAVNVARAIASENTAKVTLLHVIQTIDIPGDAPDEELQSFYEKIRSRVSDELRTLSQPFVDAGIVVETVVHVGHPLHDTVALAETRDVDLIIMSSHPVDKEDVARSWSTLSYKVSVACRCPILLLK